MDKQRNEDLNPSSDDIEAKVKRMMDPSIPDEPAGASGIPNKKSIEIQAVSAPAEPEGAKDVLPSAPELTQPKTGSKVTVAKKSKKVIIPISHHDDKSTDDAAPEMPTAPPVKQITITEHDGSTEGVAEKLDEAIAGLGTGETGEDPETAAETPEPEVPLDASETASPDTSAVAGSAAMPAGPIEPATEELPLTDPAIINDPETDEAVEEIVAAEGDELLEIEDAVRDTGEAAKPAKQPHRGLLKTLKAWWKKPAFRWAVILMIIVVCVASVLLPTSRYFVLNTVGIRASSSLVVLDSSTRQPLKNVQVAIGDSSAMTDEDGRAILKRVKLGKSHLIVQKTAFAQVNKSLVIGWGSNPLGDFSLTPTGSQYSFTVTDFLSRKPLSKIEASSGEASAVSDEKGIIKLTIDKPDEKQFSVSIKAEGLREEKISLDPDDKADHSVTLVPARKQVFVSKRSGKYDIYSVYIDGKDEKLVLAGTGNEKDGMVLVPHPKDEIAAYVSTRGGQHNNDGFALNNLLLINLADNTTTLVGTASERIQIVDWSGEHLVYVQIAAGTSANSPKRYRLMSYNYKDAANKELASSNYFNDVVSAGGAIYYAPSSAYQTGKTGLSKINPDGSGQQAIFDQEVWNIFRTAYDHFALSVQQQWYDYRLGDKAPAKLNTAPANQTPRVYISSPGALSSAWIDSRDGKGTLLLYDQANKKDASLQAKSGLGYPIRWLSDSIITYRVKTDQETADYAISVDGGDPVKIRDVTNSGGIDRWYYY